MSHTISTLLMRNLQDVFGENDPTRRRATPMTCSARFGVRAFGQPFTIVPVTGLAVATLAARDAANGSAIFNIFRNVGGSVGIALLSTLVTRREQFHDLRIGEAVTTYSPQTQARIAAVQQGFIDQGFDPVTALKQTYAVIMTRNAFVMAFNDAFLVVAIGLLVAAGAIWFCKAPDGGESHGAAG